jgi:hypothetical protein
MPHLTPTNHPHPTPKSFSLTQPYPLSTLLNITHKTITKTKTYNKSYVKIVCFTEKNLFCRIISARLVWGFRLAHYHFLISFFLATVQWLPGFASGYLGYKRQQKGMGMWDATTSCEKP